MKIDFSGKTVVVTGAAHGFGRAICLAFAQTGAQVWALDVLEDELAETGRLCREAGARCETRSIDITQASAVKALVDEVCSVSGHVDVLVNNAGGVLGQVGQPLESVTPQQWNSIFAVNLSGAFYLCQAVAPGMKAAGAGRIVNIASGAGLTVSLTGIQAYAAAKAGLISLTRQLAHELGEWGITVNCIAPGFVRSNPNTERQWQAMGSAGQQALLNGIALKRLGTADDIASGVLFFASDHAGWISGQTISIDGGK
ncbi:SDR family NAD(P)-dependent oxidoreductase [uncultured Ramlibacter sp.]|uniref:SDR family NAD(P)-dependent oxidoreductase n=1 Tax=uncultured Ramlibacter sp. TaxID=260755 RepID=UPI0026230AAC|nr:SDR family NAD(P)-dependent oxidoreductase [uncultured Ramlibacter sp.]